MESIDSKLGMKEAITDISAIVLGVCGALIAIKVFEILHEIYCAIRDWFK